MSSVKREGKDRVIIFRGNNIDDDDVVDADTDANGGIIRTTTTTTSIKNEAKITDKIEIQARVSWTSEN